MDHAYVTISPTHTNSVIVCINFPRGINNRGLRPRQQFIGSSTVPRGDSFDCCTERYETGVYYTIANDVKRHKNDVESQDQRRPPIN